MSVSVEAIGCEQLAQIRYAAASGRGSNSRPLHRKSDALPLRHLANRRVCVWGGGLNTVNSGASGERLRLDAVVRYTSSLIHVNEPITTLSHRSAETITRLITVQGR